MIQNASKHGMEFTASETKSSESTMGMCPMGKMCMGMMKKLSYSWFLMLPGILLILLGVLIVVEPRILVWFIAAATILFGIMMLMMAGFIRKIGAERRM